MRLRVRHITAYAYSTPAHGAIQVLRMKPRGHRALYVAGWRIEVDHDCRVDEAEDAFGNIVHSFTVGGPLDRLVITATGEVETEENHGIVAGQVERLPPAVFLRETRLTRSGPAIAALAEEVGSGGAGDRVDLLHRLMDRVNRSMRFDIGRTDAATPAAEAFRLGHGVCQDFAHVFIAAARHVGLPARYVGGYLYRPEQAGEQDAGHGWAEVHVDDVGWIGFDPANGISPTPAHIRVAVGLDYLGAAPVRGSRHGGTDETLAVSVSVTEARERR